MKKFYHYILITTFILLCIMCSSPNKPEYGSISGFVYIAGSNYPVSGVLVSIGDITSTTSIDGSFHLNDVPAGRSNLTAQKENYDYFSETITIQKNNTVEKIIFLTGGKSSLSGYILNLKKQPVVGAIVKVVSLTDRTDANGHYMIPSVPQGIQTIQVSHDDYDSVSVDSVYIFDVSKQFDITLVKTKYATFELKDVWEQFPKVGKLLTG